MAIGRRLAAHLLQTFDHRLIGFKQKLFFFDELSKGSCFFLPRGAHIYNKLIEYLRAEYKKRNYHEVITPNIFSNKIWKTSGHWEHYKGDMIKFQLGERDFSLKPMNCPAHCLMFKSQNKMTSAQLPIRWADFGVLHRNEASGGLLGLTRLRRFQQDDAHIFCTTEQVESEVEDCLSFANDIYTQFGFDYDLKLSSRPESYMGESSLWDKAEESLRSALDKTGLKWEEQKFEGAFYGPKIDLVVKDCRQKSLQCATIQLDFQLPDRFDLSYKDTKVKEHAMRRPVIIHRAILGSVERFIAMIAENCEGRWPFWLSPLQAQVIPVHENLNDYAVSVVDRLVKEGFMVECDLEKEFTLNKKVRNAQLLKYNFILIVGNKEVVDNSVTVRVAIENKTHNITMSVDHLVNLFKEFERNRVRHAEKDFLAALSPAFYK